MVDFRWFQQAPDFSGSLAFGVLGGLLCGFSVFGVEFCVVTAEFFELNEEVADGGFETGEVATEGEEGFDELGDLLAG